jgi:hypothetical protein
MIRGVLNEKTAAEKVTGRDPRLDDLKEIESHATPSHPAKYAFSMVDIPKVGMNPRSNFDTPAGVYFYPLTREYFEKFRDNTLPFAGNRKYVGFVKINWDSGKWLTFGLNQDASDRELSDALFYIKENAQDPERVTYNAQGGGRHWGGGNSGKIFDLMWSLMKDDAFYSEGKQTWIWNKVLKDLGYIGLYDAGTGTIHPGEPTQLFALDNRAYTQGTPQFDSAGQPHTRGDWMRVQPAKRLRAVVNPKTPDKETIAQDNKMRNSRRQFVKEIAQDVESYVDTGKTLPPTLAANMLGFGMKIPVGLKIDKLDQHYVSPKNTIRLPDGIQINELIFNKEKFTLPRKGKINTLRCFGVLG